jgi:hypothetical protein
VKKLYDIDEHRHRFSVWAAARAAQRGFTTVDNLRKALESSGVQEFLKTRDIESVSEIDFEELHRSWCRKIISSLKNAGVEERKVTFGRAAKLIAIYLKSAVVLGGKHQSALGRVAHPPIDSILLAGAAKAPAAAPYRDKWANTHWTILDEDQYYDLIRELRKFVGPDEPFWMLERYWTVTGEKDRAT